MLFNSFSFLIFFPIVVMIYLVIPKKIRYIWLLVASYYFYMSWNAKYAILMGVSTIITWICGIFLEKFSKKNQRVIIISLGLISNLGILLFFKYFDFLLYNFNKVLSIAGLELLEAPFSFLLPVGISFYTFQALGYMIDVYRGEIRAEKNPLRYALFVSFFPQLVAGPIERSGNLLRQLRNIENLKPKIDANIINGSIQMLWGLFQKMVIADRVAIFVNAIFDNIHACGTFELILGFFAFAIQLYCDFSGYSSVAIGAAKVMGFDIMDNFEAPYFAHSIKEFWHRWHISLSTWFRDYLYIPMGGNRKGRYRTYLNIMITFLVSGLWHGARWTFVVWGGMHGLYQVIGDIIKPFKEKMIKKLHIQTEVFSYRIGQIFITFCLQSFTLIFFRSQSMDEAIYYIKRLFTKWNPWVLFDRSLYTWGLDYVEVHILFISLLLLFLVDILKYMKRIKLSDFLMKQNWWFRFMVSAGLIMAILIYGEYGISFDSSQFIYFQF